jgi:hypothetical protein
MLSLGSWRRQQCTTTGEVICAGRQDHVCAHPAVIQPGKVAAGH